MWAQANFRANLRAKTFRVKEAAGSPRSQSDLLKVTLGFLASQLSGPPLRASPPPSSGLSRQLPKAVRLEASKEGLCPLRSKPPRPRCLFRGLAERAELLLGLLLKVLRRRTLAQPSPRARIRP